MSQSLSLLLTVVTEAVSVRMPGETAGARALLLAA
jgi:hypothetical protein